MVLGMMKVVSSKSIDNDATWDEVAISEGFRVLTKFVKMRVFERESLNTESVWSYKWRVSLCLSVFFLQNVCNSGKKNKVKTH